MFVPVSKLVRNTMVIDLHKRGCMVWNNDVDRIVDDIFFTESLRILAERLSQSKTHLPLRLICDFSPPEEVGVFSTEIKISNTARLSDILIARLYFFLPFLVLFPRPVSFVQKLYYFTKILPETTFRDKLIR